MSPTQRVVFLILRSAVTAIAACPATAVTAACHIYYVAPSGSDDHAGTAESPWATLGKAANAVAACDTVLVRGGTYAEAISIDQSGSADAPIRFMAYPGESPVIDGQNRLPAAAWSALIYLVGDYIDVSGFELKNSAQVGIALVGRHDAVHSMNVHHTFHNGILALGDYSLVEDSRAWQTSMENVQGAGNGMWSAGVSACRDLVDGITEGAVLRRNVVYHSWGEGLSIFEAKGGVLEDNAVFDNYAVNLYVSDASDTLVQRNLVYATEDSVALFGRPARGIGMSNETTKNPLNGITIINNLVIGTSAPFVHFPASGPNLLSNTLIANNTFLHGASGHAGDGTTVVFAGAGYSNVRFINNLAAQDDASPVVSVAAAQAGLSFNSNLWSKPPQSEASAPNDVIGDPLLRWSASGARRFKLKAGSPALRQGTVIDAVSQDYFGNPRTTTPDIGAHQRSR